MKKVIFPSSKWSPAVIQSGELPVPSEVFPVARDAGAEEKVIAIVQFTLSPSPKSCSLYEPWRLIPAHVGKFVGNAFLAQGEPPAFASKSGSCHELKDDFQQAKILVKQTPKLLFCVGFCNSAIEPVCLETISTASNHTACGETCGDEKGVTNG